MTDDERPAEPRKADAPDGPVGDADPGGEDTDGEEPGLERRLERLEEIVGALEADDVELERALTLFEEGIRHVRAAEKALSEAELRVEELLGEGGEAELRPLDDEVE